MLCTKYESYGLCRFRQKDFSKMHFENLFFLPRDLLMQQFKTISTILVGDHPGSIPIEFGQIPISVLK